MRVFITAVLLFSSCFFSSSQNIRPKRHSIDISTGFPELFSMAHPPGDLDNSLTSSAFSKERTLNPILPFNLNITYSFHFLPNWDCAARLNDIGWFYSDTSNDNPSDKRLEYEHRGLSLSILVRYYWIQKKTWQLYSSLGGGFNFMWKRIEPDISLIGFRYGGGRVYGLADLSYGISGTGIIFGVGIRL